MKKANSIFLSILLLLSLVSCGNPVENKKQEISNLLKTEFEAAEEKCLLEYTEDLCIPLYFTVDYTDEENKVNIEMFKPEQSKVELLEVGTYSDISEWCSYITHLITVNIGIFDSMTCRFDAYAKPQDQIVEIDPDILPIGELELNETEIILEQGTAYRIKVLTPPLDIPTEGYNYNQDISWSIESDPKDIISISKGGDVNAHRVGTAIVIAESTHSDLPNAKGYAKVTVVEPNRLYTGGSVVEKLTSNRNWCPEETEIPKAFFNLNGRNGDPKDDLLQITAYEGSLGIYDKRDIELKILRNNSDSFAEVQWILEQFLSNPDDISEILEKVKDYDNFEKEYEGRLIDVSRSAAYEVTIDIYGKQLNPELDRSH